MSGRQKTDDHDRGWICPVPLSRRSALRIFIVGKGMQV